MMRMLLGTMVAATLCVACASDGEHGMEQDAADGGSEAAEPVHVVVPVPQDVLFRRFTARETIPVMDLCAFDALRLAVRYDDGVLIEGERMGDMTCITHTKWSHIPKGSYDLQVFHEADEDALVYLRLYPGADAGLIYVHR